MATLMETRNPDMLEIFSDMWEAFQQFLQEAETFAADMRTNPYDEHAPTENDMNEMFRLFGEA